MQRLLRLVVSSGRVLCNTCCYRAQNPGIILRLFPPAASPCTTQCAVCQEARELKARGARGATSLQLGLPF